MSRGGAGRRAVSIVEALVAAAILAVSVAAVIGLMNQQPRAVALDETKQLAGMCLQELRAAFGHLTFEGFQGLGFPAPPAEGAGDTFNALHRTRLEDHPLITGPTPPEGAGPGRALLAQRIEAAGIRRSIYVQEEAAPIGGQRLVVTFRVYYTVRNQERHLDAHEVVLDL